MVCFKDWVTYVPVQWKTKLAGNVISFLCCIGNSSPLKVPHWTTVIWNLLFVPAISVHLAPCFSIVQLLITVH